MKISIAKYQFLQRNRAGNVLISIAVVAVILFLIGLGLVVFSGIFTQQKLGDQADRASMLAARIMNGNDRAGQMNNMLEASRELVFNSRKTYQDVINDCPDLGPFAKRFLDESRDSATELIKERDTLLRLTLEDLQQLAKTNDKETAGQEGKFALPGVPWIKTDLPSIVDLHVGYINGIESNVEAPVGNAPLLEFDLRQKYVDQSSHLYYGNMALKLPDPDTDLIFKLSALPAPVRGTISPARLASASAFHSTGQIIKDGKQQRGALCDQIPSAAQMSVVITLQSTESSKVQHPMVVSSTAASNGACPRP